MKISPIHEPRNAGSVNFGTVIKYGNKYCIVADIPSYSATIVPLINLETGRVIEVGLETSVEIIEDVELRV